MTTIYWEAVAQMLYLKLGLTGDTRPLTATRKSPLSWPILMPEQLRRRVRLELPAMRRKAEFLEAVRDSRALHRKWVSPPSTADAYAEYVKRKDDERSVVFLLVDKESDELAGVVNINEIVLGLFKSAYLGYYAFVPKEREGFMRAGLTQAINHAFRKMNLHRLEANIQPKNQRSISLVRSLGFRLEGFSPRYLKIAGRWRDHERWAILAEDWPSSTHARRR